MSKLIFLKVEGMQKCAIEIITQVLVIPGVSGSSALSTMITSSYISTITKQITNFKPY